MNKPDPGGGVDGVIVVDKPAGFTSHDVVAKLRRIVGQRRIGHAGTLDPSATGVLVVALGRATRLMRYASQLDKSYIGEVVLGTTTHTLDADGQVTGHWDMSNVELDDVRRAAEAFVGSIEQIPPMVSAVHSGGRRLHELAREGREVERNPRNVLVHDLRIEPTTENGVFKIDVRCSTGTYVRTLAADIGNALGGGAHLRNLQRTAVGALDLQSASTLSRIEESWDRTVIPPRAMISHLPALQLAPEQIEDVRHGRFLDASLVSSEVPDVALLDEAGNLVAVAQLSGDQLCPAVVLASQS